MFFYGISIHSTYALLSFFLPSTFLPSSSNFFCQSFILALVSSLLFTFHSLLTCITWFFYSGSLHFYSSSYRCSFFFIKTLLSAILSFRPYSFVLSARSLEDFFRRPRLALNVTMFGKGCFEVDLFISCYENRQDFLCQNWIFAKIVSKLFYKFFYLF